MVVKRLIKRLKRRKRVEARRLKVRAIFDEMDARELEEVVEWLLEDDGSLPHLEHALKACGYREAGE